MAFVCAGVYPILWICLLFCCLCTRF